MTNKQLLKIYEKFKKSTNYTLNDVYKNYSYEKQRIYDYWKNIFNNDKHAFNFRIVNYNTCIFTIGFEIIENNSVYFVYITPTAQRKIKVY